MGPCVVAQVPNQEPRRLRQWSGAAGGWFRITLVSFLASLPVEQLRAFPSSLSDCQTPTGWNCSGENLPHSQTRHTFTFVCVCAASGRAFEEHIKVQRNTSTDWCNCACVCVLFWRQRCRCSSLWGAGGRSSCILEFMCPRRTWERKCDAFTATTDRATEPIAPLAFGLKTDSDGCSHVHHGSLFIDL